MEDSGFQYRNLIVWQKAMLLSKAVYKLIDQLPATEKYALSDQVRRAVVSVPSNIAEGCGRASNRDYAHFLAIARGSLYETMTQLELAQSLGFIDTIKDVEELASEISRMLTSLMKKYIPLSNSNSRLELGD
jgi:S23 ribosomal protein.